MNRRYVPFLIEFCCFLSRQPRNVPNCCSGEVLSNALWLGHSDPWTSVNFMGWAPETRTIRWLGPRVILSLWSPPEMLLNDHAFQIIFAEETYWRWRLVITGDMAKFNSQHSSCTEKFSSSIEFFNSLSWNRFFALAHLVFFWVSSTVRQQSKPRHVLARLMIEKPQTSVLKHCLAGEMEGEWLELNLMLTYIWQSV